MARDRRVTRATGFQKILSRSLSVTHIYDGEEVVTGGDEGDVWVATFASSHIAERFVIEMQSRKFCYGLRTKAEVRATDQNGQYPECQARADHVDVACGHTEGGQHEADEGQDQ